MKISAPASVRMSGVRRPSKLRAAVHMTPCAVSHSMVASVKRGALGLMPPASSSDIAALPMRNAELHRPSATIAGFCRHANSRSSPATPRMNIVTTNSV